MDLVRGSPRTCPFVLLASGAVLAVLLLTPPTPAPSASTRPESIGPPSPSPSLSVDPPTWWMPTDNSTSLVAGWVGPPPGCGLTPRWYRWSVAGTTVEGTLNSSAVANVTFDATSSETGTTTLLVRSAATLECDGSGSTILGTAEANVTVVAPLALQNLSVEPDPVALGQPTAFEGTISGGEPPYQLRIAWGDGNVSSVAVARPGSFAVDHQFPAGEFLPRVAASDSAGLESSGAVPEPLTSSNTTAVAIGSENTEVDVGVPAEFSANMLDAPNGSSLGWSCSSAATVAAPQVADEANFSCSFSEVGTGVVFFELLPPIPDPLVSATRYESVEPLPELGAVSPSGPAEVGRPCAVTFNISGGVPPFLLEWQEIGTPVVGSLGVTEDGPVLVPLLPTVPGSLDLVARLVDADGMATANATAQFVVDPALNATAVVARALTASGAVLDLSGSVPSGATPFLWVVTSSPDPANETTPEGELGTAGSFDWQANYSLEGWATISWAVVDADGGFVNATMPVEAVAPFVGTLSLAPGGPDAPGTFDLALALSGGLPPFRVDVNATSGAQWNRTVASDGGFDLAFSASAAGLLGLEVRVTDSLGAELALTGAVTVAAPPPDAVSSPSSPDSGSLASTVVGGVLLVVVASAVGLYFHRRRRGRAVPPSPPDPRDVLRGIIEPADGVDRTTVELLAEEAGVPLDGARAAIDRLIADGTLRAETDPDGEEVLAWSAPNSP